MWEPRRLTTLRASMACYRERLMWILEAQRICISILKIFIFSKRQTPIKLARVTESVGEAEVSQSLIPEHKPERRGPTDTSVWKRMLDNESKWQSQNYSCWKEISRNKHNLTKRKGNDDILKPAGHRLGFFDPEDGTNMFSRNVGNLLLDYPPSRPRRQHSSWSPLRGDEILHGRYSISTVITSEKRQVVFLIRLVPFLLNFL
jgi:hypothetical protein